MKKKIRKRVKNKTCDQCNLPLNSCECNRLARVAGGNSILDQHSKKLLATLLLESQLDNNVNKAAKLLDADKLLKDMQMLPVEYIRTYLVKMDPTKDGIYLMWLVKQSKNYEFDVKEDVEVVKGVLEFFDTNKKRGMWKESKDINAFRYADLIQLRKKYEGMDLKGHNEIEVHKESELIYQDNTYAVIRSKEPEAVMKYTKGTSLCTAFEKQARKYLQKGYIYLIFKNGKKYLQFDIPSGQVKDMENTDRRKQVEPELEKIINDFVSKEDINDFDTTDAVNYFTMFNVKNDKVFEILKHNPDKLISYLTNEKKQIPELEDFLLKKCSGYSLINYSTQVYGSAGWPKLIKKFEQNLDSDSISHVLDYAFDIHNEKLQQKCVDALVNDEHKQLWTMSSFIQKAQKKFPIKENPWRYLINSVFKSETGEDFTYRFPLVMEYTEKRFKPEMEAEFFKSDRVTRDEKNSYKEKFGIEDDEALLERIQKFKKNVSETNPSNLNDLVVKIINQMYRLISSTGVIEFKKKIPEKEFQQKLAELLQYNVGRIMSTDDVKFNIKYILSKMKKIDSGTFLNVDVKWNKVSWDKPTGIEYEVNHTFKYEIYSSIKATYQICIFTYLFKNKGKEVSEPRYGDSRNVKEEDEIMYYIVNTISDGDDLNEQLARTIKEATRRNKN
jgi:hypothetical protein